MAEPINKEELRERVLELEGLSEEEKLQLVRLLDKDKKYGLVWEDKPEEIEDRMREELPVLTEVKERALTDGGENAPNHILIEGDNLAALTALSYTHEGKIDVIYIDPPYNTGNKDFVYNDSYVDTEDSYRHSKWLSFMDKRLKLAKKLLRNDGCIFISIDDNEYANLKLLCDKIFGEQNVIASICRQAIKGGSKAGNIKTVHDYVLVYAKFIDLIHPFTGIKKDELLLDLEDEKGQYTKGRELNKWGAGSRREDSPTMWFPIKGPNGEDVFPIRTDGSEGRWRWGKAKLLDAVANNDVIFEKRDNGTFVVYEKVRGLKNATTEYTTWFADDYINAKGSDAIKKIFATLMSIFDYAKPVELLRDILYMVDKEDANVLDFFAGSGTTLHATMQLNSEDGGHRQCILVTNNENNICEEVTYERNKRVIQGYTTPKGVAVEGLHNNNLRYYRTEFLPREMTFSSKQALMRASVDLLCIKDSIYTEEREFCGMKFKPSLLRYFKETDGRQMLLIFDERVIEHIVPLIAKIEGNIKVYVFSNGAYAYDDEFKSVRDKVEVCALPEALLQAYHKVLPQREEEVRI